MGEAREPAEELGQGNTVSYITVHPNNLNGNIPSSKCLLNMYWVGQKVCLLFL